MDLARILANVEGKDEMIKQIEAEVGREFVPRTEFNTKNTELKNLEKQLGELNTSLDDMTKKAADHDKTVADLTGKISSYETASLKARIAHETGIPYELAGRLSGDDEDAIRADAKSLSGLINTKQPLPPLKSTEQPAAEGKDAAYKALLSNIKGE